MDAETIEVSTVPAQNRHRGHRCRYHSDLPVTRRWRRRDKRRAIRGAALLQPAAATLFSTAVRGKIVAPSRSDAAVACVACTTMFAKASSRMSASEPVQRRQPTRFVFAIAHITMICR
jgi:hypothetical protein